MRRGFDGLLDGLSAVLLLLCLAAVAARVRSHFRIDEAGWRDGGRGYIQFASERGQVVLTHVGEYRGETSMLIGYRVRAITRQDRDHPRTRPLGHYWGGFQFFHLPDRPNSNLGDFRGVALPHWFLAALCLPLPLYRFGPRLRNRLRGRRRAARGLCPACGYDLRATPDRCPECGTAPTATTGT